MEWSSVKDSHDQLVQSVQLYRGRSVLLHGYMSPFFVIYTALFSWFWIYLDDDEIDYLVLVCGLLFLIQLLAFFFTIWSVHCRCFLSYTKVQHICDATLVKVVPTPNNGSAELVPLHRSFINEKEKIYFVFQKTKFFYNAIDERFEQVTFPTNSPVSTYQKCRGYSNDDDFQIALKTYGPNNLEMDIPEFWTLFRERATAPFFVFQVFCVGLWCLDEFWYYSLFTLFMLIAFESILVTQQLRNMNEIRRMGNKPFQIAVYRNSKWKPVLSSELIPGDVVSIGRSLDDSLVPCDLILIRGSCIVDESMLTGESVPQIKEPLDNINDDRSFNIDTDGKLHVLYGGTKILQHIAPVKNVNNLRANDNRCVAYVLRTGFQTSQGKLLRTILYGVQRVTANNLESFGFICFLLIFAIAAASYVWIHASEDPNRNRYKLMLECALILTSVVPPELPIELSLAVNSSLTSLIKLSIFCTEPFRIPFAGKIDICCFDKTGTLTSNDLVVEGIAGIGTENRNEILTVQKIPLKTMQVLATCHSLVHLDDGLVGDPLEKSTLKALDWTLTKGDSVVPRKGKQGGYRIFHRNHFFSNLKRMSVIAGFNDQTSGEVNFFVSVKGAPEVLKPMFSVVPSDYDDVYLEQSRRGARILALGRKNLQLSSQAQVRTITREEVEKDLEFVGFLVISCPVKSDSKAVMKEIVNSSHHVMMITGDAPLTACHVAKELHFISKKKQCLILVNKNDRFERPTWTSIDNTIHLEMIPEDEKKFFNKYEFCLSGDSLNALLDSHPKFFVKILPKVKVFARVAPKQKEFIITSLRSMGFVTLMCGDGTNDVGALKHAHVGVALLSNPISSIKSHSSIAHSSASMTSAPQQIERLDQNGDNRRLTNLNESSANDRFNPRQRYGGRNLHLIANYNQKPSPSTAPMATNKTHDRINQLLKELEEQDQAQIVKLGDASIAAPFTSKLSSIQCVSHIIRQGRCTLVTTLQMFKILALNALILAYCQSVLYMDGIKFSDGQALLQGLFLTGCFLFITRSQPLNVLSERRPLSNIFNLYTILTVLMQFAVHFIALVYLVQQATSLMPPREEKLVDFKSEFKPSLLNSTVYIISISLQVATFAVNYKGHPFMCSLKENRPLLYSIVGSFALVIVFVTGIMPEFSEQFSVVEFPTEFQQTILSVLIADLIMAVIIDRSCEFLLGQSRMKSQ
ncbi:cation-transporting ATPase 13A1-like protein [Sarcoptes scabiei]|uniref:Cation-transporting ATPase 13A1-like protein n=1 Tax=Sarcoptes scabiei TaxID=52283 RepID=A0A132ACW6_SARSC|nr:cation-transporting ATPase 13A1-like protein [Sarcoptes scabiei]